MPTKSSFGIILFNETEKNQLEVLLVQQRYTYSFFDFVCGRYKDIDEVKNLLRDMTHDELALIYITDFDILWHRIWLDKSFVDSYCRLNKKFTHFFLYDGGANLRKILTGIVPHGQLLWNPPRGRKDGNKEVDILCAIRELEEETGYKKSMYTLLPNINKIIKYDHDGITYKCKYYIGIINCKPIYNKFDISRSKEVSNQKWCSMAEIQFLNPKPFLVTLLKPIKKLIKKHLNGKFYTHISDNGLIIRGAMMGL